MMLESSMKNFFFKSIDLVNNLGCYKYRENSAKI
jgi:hypothetical protein